MGELQVFTFLWVDPGGTLLTLATSTDTSGNMEGKEEDFPEQSLQTLTS